MHVWAGGRGLHTTARELQTLSAPALLTPEGLLKVEVFRCSGVQVFGCSGVQVFRCFRCSGVQVFQVFQGFRGSGVQGFRGCSGVQGVFRGLGV